jgi:GNAT superfamily N-acetyltransferase
VTPHASREIPADQILALYRAEGWWPDRTAEQMRAVLDAGPAVAAWHEDRVLGFARAVTDGTLRAYLEDILVHPDVRRAGVGRALVAAILDQLRPIPDVTLFCTPDLAAYYESAGFRRTRQVVLHRA